MRLYHSPSSIDLGRRCRRAWAYVYLDGRRDPRVDWSDVTPSTPPRVRASALGVAVHGVYESWYRRQPTDWHGLPGQIALSGAHHLPHPSLCVADPEASIGGEPIPPGADEHAPATVATIAGVRWAGYRDLVATQIDPTEARRLGLTAPDMLLVDYKSTSSIATWSKTPDQLRVDLAANLYAYDTDDASGLDVIPCRWLYLETKRVRRSHPVDFVIQPREALGVIEHAAELARELDQIERSEDAPQNPAACADYGGCLHHVNAGGPCNARRSTGALIQARVRKDGQEIVMPIGQDAKARFTQASAAAAAAAAPAAPAAPPPAVTPDAPAPAPAARKPGRPRKNAAPPTPTAPADGPVGVILEAHAELAAAHAELAAAGAAYDAAAARVNAIVDRIRQAVVA